MIFEKFPYEGFRDASQEEKEAQITALVRQGEASWAIELLMLHIAELTDTNPDEYRVVNGEDETFSYHIGGALWALAVGMSGALKEATEGRPVMGRLDA